jgi:hypothetical protein
MNLAATDKRGVQVVRSTALQQPGNRCWLPSGKSLPPTACVAESATCAGTTTAPRDQALSAATFKRLLLLRLMLVDMDLAKQKADITTHPVSTVLLQSLMQYKRWADAELIAALLTRPELIGAVPEGSYITAIVRHYHTVDCIFRAHLLGVPHGFDSPNPAEPATLEALREHVAATDAWYVAYARGLSEHDLSAPLIDVDAQHRSERGGTSTVCWSGHTRCVVTCCVGLPWSSTTTPAGTQKIWAAWCCDARLRSAARRTRRALERCTAHR